jgi:putative colanic acid biosynthesis acetyltransferase WcaF
LPRFNAGFEIQILALFDPKIHLSCTELALVEIQPTILSTMASQSFESSGLNVSNYKNLAPRSVKLRRLLWFFVQHTVFAMTPKPFFSIRRLLAACFGAKLDQKSFLHRTSKVWDPKTLSVGKFSSIGPGVHLYSVDQITIGDHCTISMNAVLCTGSHDITDPGMKLTHAPISVGSGAWICAHAFIGPGVTIGEGAVIAAAAVVTKDVLPWQVVGGNPARFIKERKIQLNQ